MAIPSTFNCSSLLDKQYEFSSSTYWHILPFITLKIAVVTDSYRDTKFWLKLHPSGLWRWTEAWEQTVTAFLGWQRAASTNQGRCIWRDTVHPYVSGVFWCTKSFYYTLPYTWKTFPSFVSGIILFPVHDRSDSSHQKQLHCEEHWVLSLDDKCSHCSQRVKTCLSGQQRVCTQLPINMR